jgi:hypothetical protein
MLTGGGAAALSPLSPSKPPKQGPRRPKAPRRGGSAAELTEAKAASETESLEDEEVKVSDEVVGTPKVDVVSCYLSVVRGLFAL